MYLRFDFSSSANVGYGASISPPLRPLTQVCSWVLTNYWGETAFVNFIDVQDLLLFAKTKLGVKWNMYSSDKVLQMSYANFQGKEALVEKFKNSCVMEMQVCSHPLLQSYDFISSSSESYNANSDVLGSVCCRTNGSQKYFTHLVRTMDNANLSPHRAMFPALDAARTNGNGASYVLNISCSILPPVVTDVICEWNEGRG